MISNISMIHNRKAVLIVLFATLLGISAQAQPWRFVYMSDHRSSLGHHPGVSTQTVSRLVADMLTNRIDLVLIGGDLIHGDNQPTSGLIDQYNTFKSCLVPLTNAGIPYYAIPGNHEFWSENSSWSQATDAWWQAFGQFLPQNGPTSPCPERGMTYSFNHKSALFLGVNMYTNDPTGWSYKGADTNWVQTQLVGNTKPHVFAFGHVPQTMIASNDATVQTTVDFWNLLADARCYAYFCGHKHSYQRTLTRAPSGAGYIHEVMDGSGMDVINSNGPPWWGAGNPIAVEYLCSDDTMRGYVLVDVDGLNVSVTRRCFYTNALDQVYWTNMDSFACTADPGSNWSFAVFGDTRGDVIFTPSEPILNTPVIQAICAAITNDGALCALVPGDIVLGQEDGVTNTLDYQLALWTNAVSALGRAGIPYYAVRGNHEIHSADETNRPAHADWTKQIGRYMPTNGPEGELGMTYSIPFVNALFIGLDTYAGTNDNQNYHMINQAWLDAQLSANTQTHVFVFGHEPAFQAHASSTCLSENLPERNRFWDSIGNANARAYLTGHSHVYGRCFASISNGPALRQIIVGAGGAPLESWWNGEYSEPAGSGALIVPETNHTPANTYGYTLVHVSGNHVEMIYKTTTNLTTWTTNDVFAYTIAAPPTNVSPGVCADYDGDRLADPAVYDEATGTWKVKLSSAGYSMIVTTLNGLGGPGYASVSADYDGDRKADPAVYDELTGHWAIMLSSANYAVVVVLSQTLGGAGYSGMPADYDGDGKADPGVYQRERGDWKVLMSSANYNPVEVPGLLGGTGNIAVAADYDGDNKADPAIYGENNGYWIFKLSSANYITIVLTQTLGGTGYIPVPADYDGDAKADPAVMSQTSNEWIVMFSSDNYTPVSLTIPFE